MRKSIATVSLSGTLDEKLTAMARVGFDGVEIFENDLVNSHMSPAEVRRLADDLGLTVDLYQPFRDFEAVPEKLFESNLRRAERKFDVMEQLGAATMLVCSNVSDAAVDDDDLAAAQLYELADRAARRGVRIAYEALAWGRHVHDYRHAHDIVAAADHPHLGICLDSFHILSRGDDPAAITEIPGEKIFFLQLADAPQLVMDVLQWSRHYRCFPGQGGFDLPPFLEKVVAAGYRGPLSLEVFNDVFRQAESARTAVDAMRSLLHLEESLRGRLAARASETSSGVLAQARSRVELFAPPAPATLQGYAFAELGVGSDSAPATGQMLGALGFTEAGRHHSKPVTLWRQGDIYVLLNSAASDVGQFEDPESPTRLAALGVQTSDAVRAANRAEALRAPIVPRRRGPGEVDLPTVQATDGTTILFCAADENGPRPWLADFDVPAADGTDKPLLTHVDHIALSLPFDQFDEGILFFRSVLGLQPQESLEIADPYGLVRSRALATTGQTVRIALNVSQLGHHPTPSPADSGLQHIAFACDDIFATARALRARGLRCLPIPDNYYDDLAARWDLPDEFVASLRELNILYDRSPDGEFYHLYTQTLGHRLFFEVVQRVGDYTSYGAANTPIRMAAQRTQAAIAPHPDHVRH